MFLFRRLATRINTSWLYIACISRPCACGVRKKKDTREQNRVWKGFFLIRIFPFRKTGAEAANSSALWRQQNIHLVPQTSTQWSRSACAVRLAHAHKHTIKTQIKSGMKGWLHRERQREHSVRRSIEWVGCGEGCRTFYRLQTKWCLQNNHSQVASEPDRSQRCNFHKKNKYYKTKSSFIDKQDKKKQTGKKL